MFPIAQHSVFADNQRYFNFLKKVARHEFRKYGFLRVSTPLLDDLEPYTQAFGEYPDFFASIAKVHSGKQAFALKREASVPMMRLYMSKFVDDPQPVHHYAIERHFSLDAEAGDINTQSHTISAEVTGENDPVIDTRLIALGVSILNGIGLKGQYKVRLNFLPTGKEREKYTEELKWFFATRLHLLSPKDQETLNRDPLALFASEEPDTQEVLRIAPSMASVRKKDSKEWAEKTREYLKILDIEYEEDPFYVSTTPYAGATVWQFELPSVAGYTPIALGTGCRREGFSQALGYKHNVPTSGFTLSVERIIDAMRARGVSLRNKDALHLYLVQLGDDAKKLLLPLNQEARDRGLNALLSLGTPSLKTQVQKAIRLEARFVAMVGIMEAKHQVCQLRDMKLGTQEEVPLGELLEIIVERIGPKALDFYDPARDFIIE